MTTSLTRRHLAAAALALLVPLAAGAEEKANPLQPSESWEAMRVDVVGEREILDGSGVLTIEAPFRAHDAAIVPVEVKAVPGSDAKITRVTLVIDENPAPVAAEFEIGPAMGALDISTRVRVDAYSNIRAIAETADGRLYMVGRYVKASGGCSAPAQKDADAALAAMGQMKLRVYDVDAAQGVSAPREAQVMLRHPNYSGLQMNQLTRLYIPAHFVHAMAVHRGDDLVFRMSGGISISEDPTFRFGYVDDGAGGFRVEATDTEGMVFEGDFPAGTAPS